MMVWSLIQSHTSWSVRSKCSTMNKASGDDGIPAELFQILKDDVKVMHSICQQIWKTQQWPQDWKRSVFIFKLLYNCIHFTCQQGYAQNPPSQALTIYEPRTPRSSQIQKRQRKQRPNCQNPLNHRKIKRIPEKYLLLFH